MADLLWLIKEFYFGILLMPLRWLPDPVIEMLRVCLVVFTVVVIGRILKWLWDLIPVL